ncbi:MAG: UDP-glucose/GDP-mannose dehydrogenase family protein [Magnetococcales bacterium]|nr:UDP-glucose/GDP-mannose dehydrogenase family protein [Magnetococcales bacterium]
MRITMIGAGYVGLVSGACFSEFGVDVTCVDTDAAKIERLNQGKVPIYEPGLDQLILRNTKAGRLRFVTADELAPAAAQSDAVFIAVGTPERRGDGAADLTYVYEAARQIAACIQRFTVVVTKSTVPVGTGARVADMIRAANPEAHFAVASNPEFLREGSAIEDFMRPDRVVIGVNTERAAVVLRELYRPLHLIETPILFTNLVTAELIKYASNAFLATKITFINQMANLCEAVGADVHHVAKGMGLDRRIGPKFLHPGPGYGGSCFPKDTLALAATARAAGEPATIVETVVEANRLQKLRMVEKIRVALGGDLAGKSIGVLGLTFKPNTDDMREAPALVILPALLEAGAKVCAFDPEGMREARKYLPDLHYVDGVDAACSGADALVILTEWNQFRTLDWRNIRSRMKPRADGQFVLCDLRNVFEPATMRQAGFHYVGVGRG